MKTRTLKQTCSSALYAYCGFDRCILATVSAQAPERTIQGVWRTMVTPVNCQTGDPLGPPFASLLTFNTGGTMSEYGISPGLSPALRSPGHGFGSTSRVGRITRTRSRSIGITRAAFLSDRRELGLPWNSEQAAMSLQRTLQSKFSMPTAT